MSTKVLLLIVAVVAFVAGYAIVTWVMGKIAAVRKSGRRYQNGLNEFGDDHNES